MSEEAYGQCVKGAMAFLVQLNLGSPQAVNGFCGAIDPDHRDLCFQSAGENFRSWAGSDEELAEKCNELSRLYIPQLAAYGLNSMQYIRSSS